ncbi:hypothetical protein [Phaeodactylibacter xiamenensis]|uniref:hypothetical protein n=1 Tax=Phaeodactylibacter xiamenensis TaxID=1524460 RepID=UPI003CCBA58B
MENSLIESFDINAYVSKYVTNKLFDVALIGLKNAIGRINKNNKKIEITKFASEDCIDYIAQHLKENIRWATNISFRDSNRAKNINDIFIELDLFIKPIKLRVDSEEKIKEIPISEILSDSDNNIVLLGQPGAGKTTSVKKLFLELLNRESEVYKVFNFPLIIRLKDLKRSTNTNGLIWFSPLRIGQNSISE